MAVANLITVVAVEGSVLSGVSTEAIREVFLLFNFLANLIFVMPRVSYWPLRVAFVSLIFNNAM
jgi:hypothetical protein